MVNALGREDCLARDQADPIGFARERFVLPDRLIYLDGNSLGALPQAVAPRLQQVVEQEWAQGLIRSWNDAGWYTTPQRAAARIARLIGAQANEVIVADSTSVNLFKLLHAGIALQRGLDPARNVLLTDAGNFPTDQYVGASVARQTGMQQIVVPAQELPQAMWAMRDRLAMLHLTHVDYRSGRLHDMPGLTAQAHMHHALVLWDLAHTAGAMPVSLDALQVDFAVGCGYKYLNGGPGAPAFAYVAARHIGTLQQPLTGWHGHARPFGFEPEWEPASGIERLLCGTAPMLSLLALEAALQAFDDVDLQAIRHKSEALTSLFIDQIQAGLSDTDAACLRLVSPPEPAARGSQVSFAHPQAYAVVQALIARGVIGDFREPDLMRFGFAPLYLRHVDVFDAAAAVVEVLRTQAWDRPEYAQRRTVT